jgi:acyl-CoA reductase-like NAD-dependent aldehyde dehydrogenase
MFERGGGTAQAHLYAANGQVTSELTLCSPEDVDAAVKAAREAHPAWRALPGDKRRDLMFRLAALVEANTQSLAQLGIIEKGELAMVAPYIPMVVAQKFRYFGGWADKIQGLTVSTWGGPATSPATRASC